MDNFKDKAQAFIIGLMVGLIVAGGFFILKLDDYFKELNFYKTVAKTFSVASKNHELVIKNNDSEDSKDKEISGHPAKNKKNSSITSQPKSNFSLNSDTLKSQPTRDSSKVDVFLSDDIVVRKDELLSTKTMEVINLSPLASRTNSKDSLLQKLSGIKDEKIGGPQFFNIEFWNSPLNYKGYKMSKYKIVLYGLGHEEGLKIFKLDDAVYLKISSQVLHLEYSSDFRPYEQITDESIINRLK